MRVVNRTNVFDAERVVRLCGEGVDTSGLIVYVMFPETEEDKGLNGCFIPDCPPKIKIFLHDRKRYKFGARTVLQHVALVFKHELLHFVAWKKGIVYVKETQEPLADFYAYQSLNEIGMCLKAPPSPLAETVPDKVLDYDSIVKEASAIESLEINSSQVDIIILPGYVDRGSISSSFREKMQRTPSGGIETKKVIYARKFHCGHISKSYTGKDLGRDCTNRLPPNRSIPHWHERYHLVCKECLIPGCNGCGIPGDKICFTLVDGQWLCADCLNA